MRHARSFLFLSVLAAALAASASSASAQVKQLAGGYLVGSFPMGDWGKVAGFGLALDGTDIVKPKPDKWFSIRNSLGLLYNFSRTEDVPKSNLGPNDALDIETKNWSVFFGVGPEFSKPHGATPILFGTVGFDTYWTRSTLSGTANGAPYSAEHGDSRIAFAWSAGLGFRKVVAAGNMVELSAEYRSGIEHSYLRPEDVKVSGGAVIADRSSHSSDQILVRLGTVLGD